MQTHSILLGNSFKLSFISVIQVIIFLSSQRQISKFRSQGTGGYIRLHSRRNSAGCRLLLRTLERHRANSPTLKSRSVFSLHYFRKTFSTPFCIELTMASTCSTLLIKSKSSMSWLTEPFDFCRVYKEVIVTPELGSPHLHAMVTLGGGVAWTVNTSG